MQLEDQVLHEIGQAFLHSLSPAYVEASNMYLMELESRLYICYITRSERKGLTIRYKTDRKNSSRALSSVT